LLLTRNVGLVNRLILPAGVFLIAAIVWARAAGHITSQSFGNNLKGATQLFKSEYLGSAGSLAILYTVLFTLAGMLERLAPALFEIPAETVRLNDYLLVLAFGLAFQSLLSIGVDWARPSIATSRGLSEKARSTVFSTGALLMVAAAGGATVGFALLKGAHLLPEWTTPRLWILVISRFALQLLVFLFQVDLIIAGRLLRASAPWFVLIAVQLVVIGGSPSVANLQSSLVAAVITAGVIAIVEGGTFLHRTARPHV
jgi:hypothetical protein